MSSRRQSPAPKRALPIKRADGEPLDRADIQYDVLHAIFSDTTIAFTDPYATKSGGAHDAKLSFGDLYVKAILNSSKATKALKDKMAEFPEFSQDFAMLALLVNVGRINTTMSFFPEMRTTTRTYHPVPALQRTSGNLQDAPRIKHILKAGLLEGESPSPPQTPEDVLSRAGSGHIPSTGILNLMFVLSSHSAVIASHFSQRFEFLDVFLKNEYSSFSRARAFLWMCFNYLENPGFASDDYDAEEIPNPFAEPNKNTAPVLISLTPEEMARENVDSPEEKALEEKLLSNRDTIVKQHAVKGEKNGKGHEEDEPSASVASGDEVKAPKGRKKGGRQPAADKPEKPKRATKKPPAEKAQSRRNKLKNEAMGSASVASSVHADDMSVDDDDQQNASFQPTLNGPRLLNVADHPDASTSGFRILTGLASDSKSFRSRVHRYSPYQKNPAEVPRSLGPVVSQRTMLQYAWETVSTTDPLMDSDTEAADDGDHYEYAQRLKVVSRLAQFPWKEPSHALHASVEVSPT